MTTPRSFLLGLVGEFKKETGDLGGDGLNDGLLGDSLSGLGLDCWAGLGLDCCGLLET